MKKAFVFYAFLFCFTAFYSCKKNTLQGSDLKNEDAIQYLAEEAGTTWQLQTGHDYYEFLCFTKNKQVKYQNGTSLNFEVNGPTLTIHDFKPFVYQIIELSNTHLKMAMAGHDTLTYIATSERIEPDKSLAKPVDAKWLKGKYGTTWKFVEGDKTYSFMNDGNIIDANTLAKVETWSMHETTLNFGVNKLTVSKLSPIFFDYDVYGVTVKLNYVCEANKDGSPTRH